MYLFVKVLLGPGTDLGQLKVEHPNDVKVLLGYIT